MRHSRIVVLLKINGRPALHDTWRVRSFSRLDAPFCTVHGVVGSCDGFGIAGGFVGTDGTTACATGEGGVSTSTAPSFVSVQTTRLATLMVWYNERGSGAAIFDLRPIRCRSVGSCLVVDVERHTCH